MVGILILFNPLLSIHFEKGVWVVLDVITALIFIVFMFSARKVPKSKEEEWFDECSESVAKYFEISKSAAKILIIISDVGENAFEDGMDNIISKFGI
jgi:hypothetical protein